MPEVPEVEDPPASIYVPTHRESMRMLEPVHAGDYMVGPMLSYPHPFWLVDGDETERVEPEAGRGVHLMFTLWDMETGVVLPAASGAELLVEQDDEPIGAPLSPWPMLSQEMGFHFGDNIPLPEDGTYTVTLDLPPLDVELAGDLAGTFDESASASFTFDYDDEFRQSVVGGIEYFDEELWGEPGAIEPMHGDDEHGDHDHDHGAIPYSALPPASEYSGTVLGTAETGDVDVIASVLPADSRLAEGDGQYLLVSPRTTYNRVPLPDMSLSVSVAGSDPISLTQRIDGTYDHHYGTTAAIADGDEIAVTFGRPPQVARHQGYETAFFDLDPVHFTVS